MRVKEGDVYVPDLADPSTEHFRLRAREYREGLNLWLRRSELKSAFLNTDILAFDGEESEDLKVHFNLHFNVRRLDVTPEDITKVLTSETSYLGNRTIDPDSVFVQEANSTGPENSKTASISELVTTTPNLPPPRRCASMDLPYCTALHANMTSYPNIVGHNNIDEVKNDIIAFRELIDAECYRLAYDFVCQILQPPCSSELVLPCRSFCREFWAGCGQRLPPRLQKMLNCTNFPEYSAEGPACVPKPGCGDDLESQGLESLICDGVADCPDLSDETSCPHCPSGSLHCASTKACVHPYTTCDGVEDCPDGSDERSCLSLAPNLKSLNKLRSVQAKHYYTGGNVIFTEKGLKGKLCVGNLNTTVPMSQHESVLQTIASSLCRSLSFTAVEDVTVDIDEETDSRYVKMENPMATEISFIPYHCPTKEILSVHCSKLECGISTVRNRRGVHGLPKMSQAGDWPWHIPLFKAGTHVCDGTLIDLDWIVTTASCFQGQGKAEWIARAGSTRLPSTTPWQQERHIIGMVKSPVEGSTIVLLRLDRKFTPSDFVRPICLPPKGSSVGVNLTYCNTLGWGRERSMLQRVELKISNMEQCANISITTVNSICTDSYYSNEDCTEEELAGSPMLCLHPDEQRWVLTGVSNWRIACSKIGDQRPRLYDKIISNVDWITSITEGS
ncbi:hypothetical protein AAG570_000462 [Ranatra chinensis]|uniref:Atrial natriuretic peptide-converting enzyme n=1 Tax=Ranatra chinensis TaxID=642074 RepID=A0ABD0Z7J0_9HEMI